LTSLLRLIRRRQAPPPEHAARLEQPFERPLRVEIDEVVLAAELLRPQRPQGLVICADGDGLSRISLRNRKLTAVLSQVRFATLLADLRTEEEQRRHAVEPDFASLASRLEAITRWAADEPDVGGLSIGYFAAAASATVALEAAAVADVAVHAVVSLDGHPDLAADLFGRVSAATLLLVGSRDRDAVERSRRAARRLRGAHCVTVVDGRR